MRNNSSKMQFRVTGGNPLSGTIEPQGNKNEALPVLAACCLTNEPVTFSNMPNIEDVTVMQEIIAHLGLKLETEGDSLRV